MSDFFLSADIAAPSPIGRALIIDEDTRRRASIVSHFVDNQWAAVGTGQSEIARHVQCRQLSLVALSARSGFGNALDVLRQIRSRSHVPLIMYREGVDDGVQGVLSLEMGADDFITGSLNLHELLARARAVLRRQELGRLAPQPSRGGYRFAGWELQHATRGLICPSGTSVVLTRSEYALLCALLEAPGRTLSRLHLMRATRAHDDIYDRSIDVQVLRLRRKLVGDSRKRELIRTERSFGYRLDAEVETLY